MKAKQIVNRSHRMAMVRLVHGVTNDDALRPHTTRFGGAEVNPVIPNQRVGEGEHLAGERRVRQRLLKAHHTRREHQLTRAHTGGAEQFTQVSTAVRRQQHPGPLGALRKVLGSLRQTVCSIRDGQCIGIVQGMSRWEGARIGIQPPEHQRLSQTAIHKDWVKDG